MTSFRVAALKWSHESPPILCGISLLSPCSALSIMGAVYSDFRGKRFGEGQALR